MSYGTYSTYPNLFCCFKYTIFLTDLDGCKIVSEDYNNNYNNNDPEIGYPSSKIVDIPLV